MLNKFLAGFLVFAVAVAVDVLVMVYGWGLQPRSWLWILAIGIFGRAVLSVIGDRVLKS